MALPQDPEEQKRYAQNQLELAKRELERRSHDRIRVYNPLDTTFSFMYDRYWHRVPAKSYRDFERYLAIRFFKKICDYMIGQQQMVKGQELKELREKQLGQQFLDKYEENVQIWDKVPKLNDPDLIEQIKQVVLIGVVEEYGMDEPPLEPEVHDNPQDMRGLHEQIFSSIDTIKAPEHQEMLKPVENVPTPKKPTSKTELAKEVLDETL